MTTQTIERGLTQNPSKKKPATKVSSKLSQKSKYIAYAALVLTTLIWSTTFVSTKLLIGDVNPVMLLVYRFGFAGFALGLFLVARGYRKVLFKDFPLGFMCGALLWMTLVAQNLALQITTINNANFILGLFIVFVPFLSLPILNRKIKPVEYFVLAMSILGIWLLTGGISGPNWGDWICLGGALTYALFLVLSNKVSKREDPLVETFQQFLTVAILSLVTVITFRLPIEIRTYQSFVLTAYLALIPSLVCYILYNKFEKNIDPFVVSLIISLDTFITPIFAAIFVHEPLTNNILLGGSIISLSILLTNEKLRSKVKQLIWVHN